MEQRIIRKIEVIYSFEIAVGGGGGGGRGRKNVQVMSYGYCEEVHTHLALYIYTCVYVEKGRLGRHGEEVERRAKSSVGFFSSSCWCSADSGALI